MRSMSLWRTILLQLLLWLGVYWLGSTVHIAVLNTLAIFILVTISGLWLCHRTRVSLKDPRISLLGTFWLFKIAITIFLLYAGWIPELDEAISVSWGYDPQRYFRDAWKLIENGWNPVVGSNYQGIIYYFAGIFYLFGHNPVIPALINAFVTLLGTRFLIRCAYTFSAERTGKDWTIACLLLVPEVLWYDVMTSRETLMLVLILIAALSAGKYMVGICRASLSGTLLLSGAAFAAILMVRTSMVIPLVVSITAMALILKSHRTLGPVLKVLLIAMGVGALLAGPLIQQFTGGYNIDYFATLNRIQSVEANVAAHDEWSENSIGLLLVPSSAWQSIVFLLPRMLLYLATPLPNIYISLTELISGSWSAWQRLMVIPTSAMMLLGFPFVLAGTAQAWRNRKRFPAPLIIPITFWVTFASVAGGNLIVHGRYRLMFTLLLFACMWQGYTCCRTREVRRWTLRWIVLLAMCALFYLVYKFLI
ncbi:MAG: hypothetical protein HND49_03855 [Planctomycetes bacterium]|nr:hypothetical protein [Planctomycetota bacterium]